MAFIGETLDPPGEFGHEGTALASPVKGFADEDVAKEWDENRLAAGEGLAEAMQEDRDNLDFGVPFGDMGDARLELFESFGCAARHGV
jgi:hypothetical protein